MSLSEIHGKFKKMEKRDKVDLKIVKSLEKYKESLIKVEKKFLNSKNLTEKFEFYYLLKSQIRAIDSLVFRIRNPIPHDNPKVVDDVLKIWPSLQHADLIINKSKYGEPSFEIATQIQSDFIKYNLYPSPEEILNEMNKKSLKKNFNLFVSNIGEEVYEC